MAGLGTAVAVVALGLTPAVGVTTASSPLPKYLDPEIHRFAVYANSHWTLGGTTNAAGFTGSPAPDDWGYGTTGDPVEYMWAHRCSAGSQTVEFRRKVWLPGRPQTFDFHARPIQLTQHGQTWSSPLRVVKLLVNGTLMTKSKTWDTTYSTYDAATLAAFKRGTNTFRVVAVKRANPSYISACSGKKAPARFGIQVAMIGSGFPVDIGFQPQTPAGKVKYFHIQPGQSQAFLYTFVVHNYGPSSSRAGRFQLRLQRGFMQLSYPMDTVFDDPFHPCVVTGGTIADCTYDDDWLPAGGSANLKMYWKLTAPKDQANNDVEQVLLDWTAGSTNGEPDRNPANNSGSKILYFCYPQATAYGCDKN
jgi:hypothetical protein